MMGHGTRGGMMWGMGRAHLLVLLAIVAPVKYVLFR
jgi:hypothetical protein